MNCLVPVSIFTCSISMGNSKSLKVDYLFFFIFCTLYSQECVNKDTTTTLLFLFLLIICLGEDFHFGAWWINTCSLSVLQLPLVLKHDTTSPLLVFLWIRLPLVAALMLLFLLRKNLIKHSLRASQTNKFQGQMCLKIFLRMILTIFLNTGFLVTGHFLFLWSRIRWWLFLPLKSLAQICFAIP